MQSKKLIAIAFILLFAIIWGLLTQPLNASVLRVIFSYFCDIANPGSNLGNQLACRVHQDANLITFYITFMVVFVVIGIGIWAMLRGNKA